MDRIVDKFTFGCITLGSFPVGYIYRTIKIYSDFSVPEEGKMENAEPLCKA